MAQGGKNLEGLVRRLMDDEARNFYPPQNQLVPVPEGHLEPVQPPTHSVALRPDERQQVEPVLASV